MRDLFSQCTYVCVCHAQECQFALTCTQRSSCVTCTDTRAYRMPSLAIEDREERRFLTMEDEQHNTAGPPQRMRFAESLPICTMCMAWREASCACVVLVYLLRADQEIMMNLIQVIKIRPLFIPSSAHIAFRARLCIITIAHVLLLYQCQYC